MVCYWGKIFFTLLSRGWWFVLVILYLFLAVCSCFVVLFVFFY